MNKAAAIIVPCFNEEFRFPKVYWKKILQDGDNIKWVFVDDGSTDDTYKMLKEVSNGTSAQVIRLSQNVGKGNAIRIGFQRILEQESEISVLGFIDSDGAFKEDEVFRIVGLMFEKWNDSILNPMDALIASRVALSGRSISRKTSRHYLGRIIATVITNKWTDSPYDTQCGFKLFSNSEAFIKSIKTEFKTRWFVDIEILTRLAILKNGDLSIWEEPLFFWKDVGESKIKKKHILSILRDLFVARRQVLKLLKVRKMQSFVDFHD
jgi:glycosyltransferase involved in cell wall biosynthesis